MSQENIQHKIEPDAFPKLFYPETTKDLFFNSTQEGNTQGDQEMKNFLKFLMYGFSVTSNGMLVTFLDKEHVYNDGEAYVTETRKAMHPFCDAWRNKCGMKKTCIEFDRHIANILLGLDNNGKPWDYLWKVAKKRLEEGEKSEDGDAVIFECYAGMYDMAYRIRIAGRPFAVLLAGQVSPDLTGKNTVPIENNLRSLCNRYPTDDPNKIAVSKLLGKMKEKAPEILKEEQLESLVKFGSQLEIIFEGLYKTKRHNTEDSILVECLRWCKKMNGITPLMLTRLRDALGLDAIILFRGEGPLKPERSMGVYASSIPKMKTIDVHEYWSVVTKEETPVLLAQSKWEKFRKYLNDTLGLNLSDSRPAIIVANGYDSTLPSVSHSGRLPFILLAIGNNSNLHGINNFFRHLLRELESFIDTMESQKNLEETKQKRDSQSKFHEHEMSKNVQQMVNIYSRLKELVRQSSDEKFRHSGKFLCDNFASKVRSLSEIAQFPKTFAEEEYKVPDFECQLENMDLVPLVDKSIAKFENAGSDRRIFVRWLNKPSHPMPSFVDERLFAIAVDEVLSNAVKYSFAGSDVQVFMDSRKDCWSLTVHDFGIRIPEDKLEEVFEPGRRLKLEPMYREVERSGSGMGLAYVKAIIEKHGGNVSITCLPGRNAKENPVYDREQGHHILTTILIPIIQSVQF